MTSPRRRTPVIGAVASLIAASTVLAGAMPVGATAAAASSVTAVGSWSMVPLTRDVNKDGQIDGDGGVPRTGATTTQPSVAFKGAGNHIAQPHERLINGTTSWYLPAGGFPVRLDACRSKGASYRWTAEQNGTIASQTAWRALAKKTCTIDVTLANGPTTLTLEVKRGSTVVKRSLQAAPRGIVVVALGDSYSSGEGVPRNVGAWLTDGAPFRPYWDDDACHRSVLGAPAQAALALEKASPTTSVLLVDVTCAGATVDAGILGPQVAEKQASSQVEQVRAILGDRPADAVVLQVGGNDVGFASLLGACLLSTDCPLSRAPFPPLSAFRTVQDGVQALTGRLPADYARIARCLGGSGCALTGNRPFPGVAMAPGAKVLPVMYPDITRAADGSSCRYLTLTPGDFAWARDTILLPTPGATYPYASSRGTVALSLAQGTLNQRIAQTGSTLGWAPVTGTWDASGAGPVGHGVCAGGQAWVFGVTALAGFPSGSFHPNPIGAAAMGQAIAAALRAATPGA